MMASTAISVPSGHTTPLEVILLKGRTETRSPCSRAALTGGTMTMRVSDKQLNGGGFIHDGALMTFADFCLFAVAQGELHEAPAVTLTFSSEFVAAAPAGNLIECTGEVIRSNRSLVFSARSHAERRGAAPVFLGHVEENPPHRRRSALIKVSAAGSASDVRRGFAQPRIAPVCSERVCRLEQAL